MKVAIVKYSAGNVSSVLYALRRLGIDGIVTDSPDELISADKVIFPGVGSAGEAIRYLKTRELDKLIVSLKQPVLGICLGMQLLCDYSEEDDTTCLGIFKQSIRKIRGKEKVPHVGWNNIAGYKTDLFKGLDENAFVYFVHSYYAELGAYTASETNYGGLFSSALQYNNFYGVQFHPEKSDLIGNTILKNFIEL